MVELGDNILRISLARQVDDSYNIVFGCDLFPQIARDLMESPISKNKISKYAVITDSNVKRFHLSPLEDALQSEGLIFKSFSFEAGEPNKTIDSCMNIMGDMTQSGFGRDCAILALGGGVVGDLAGFVAAIFNRGVPYVQIPTTLVSQADSSVGGKTAVDTKHGKNLVGAFKQPSGVYIDVSTLKTLSDREYISGLAETVKHGVIRDNSFFGYLEGNIGNILERSPNSSLYIARNNCRIKGEVVEIDPHEKGLRKILNYGHTVGHAVEKISVDMFEGQVTPDYLRHGGGVSIGMMVAGRIAVAMDYFPEKDLGRQEQLLINLGLPVRIPEGMPHDAIVALTSTDKKTQGGVVRYVLPSSMGQMNDFGGAYSTPVKKELVLEALRQTA